MSPFSFFWNPNHESYEFHQQHILKIATFTPKSLKLRKSQNHHFFCNNFNHKPKTQVILKTDYNKLNKCVHAHAHTNKKSKKRKHTFHKTTRSKKHTIRGKKKSCKNKYTSRKKRCTLHLKGANTKL